MCESELSDEELIVIAKRFLANKGIMIADDVPVSIRFWPADIIDTKDHWLVAFELYPEIQPSSAVIRIQADNRQVSQLVTF